MYHVQSANSYNSHDPQQDAGWNSGASSSQQVSVPPPLRSNMPSSVVDTPPPRRPKLASELSSNAAASSGAPAPPKLSLLTPRNASPAPTGLPTSRKLPSLSLNVSGLSVPKPGSSHPAPSGASSSTSSHPSPAFDEHGGQRTAYHGGLRTPTASSGYYDSSNGGQTTMMHHHQDENQRTVQAMTADLRNALSQMRITPTPPQSHRASFESDHSSDDYAGSTHSANRLSRNASSSSHKSSTASRMTAEVLAAEAIDTELNPANYETVSRLGEGAGGAVEKVKDKRTGMVLAMKVSFRM